MDGFTESIVIVLGHPVGGNPSQFAIEKGLASIDLDWRVLSLDVEPADLPAAIEGFRVTGIHAVWLDSELAEDGIDGYVRTEDQWQPFEVRDAWRLRDARRRSPHGVERADRDGAPDQSGDAGVDDPDPAESDLVAREDPVPASVAQAAPHVGQLAEQLQMCIEIWAHQKVAIDVLIEAIEEYESV